MIVRRAKQVSWISILLEKLVNICISYNLHIAKLGQSHVTIYIELYLTRTQMANNLTQELYILLSHNCGGLALSLHPTFKVNVKMFTEFTQHSL